MKQAEPLADLKVDAEKLNDRIANDIGIEIATGALPEGSVLPTEVEAAERLGVSRTAYREAIRVLTAKGLVTSRKKAGTRVNYRRQWALLDPAVLGWMFARKPTPSSVKSLFELRMMVEPAAAALAADRRTPEQLSEMGHALEEMARYGLKDKRGQVADGRFHATILEAAENEFLLALVDPIATAIRWTTILKFAAARPPRDPMVLHRDLYSAIVDRDADRARAVSERLLVEAREDTEISVGLA